MPTYRDDPRVDPLMRAALAAYEAALLRLLPDPPALPDQRMRTAWAAARRSVIQADPRDHGVRLTPWIGGEARPRAVLFRPPEPRGMAPAIVWVHGGGWCLGGIATLEHVFRRLCTLTGFAVVALEYRLAPEHPFPAALDDVRMLFGQDFSAAGIDPGRLVLAGDSAGGNLALAFALSERPALRGLALAYPVTDSDLDTPSYREFAEGFGLTRAAMALFWRCYVPDVAGRADPAVAPLGAPSLAGLPPVHLQLAGLDVLRDDSLRLEARLREAGVPTETLVAPGLVHGYLSGGQGVPASAEALAALADWARRRLA
ncbi:MAG: alpha/beta hydrolase [Acetobacteraceae bacterium]|nr:alpha/beta hydrolase [Acetobacteraceae bacterium]